MNEGNNDMGISISIGGHGDVYENPGSAEKDNSPIEFGSAPEKNMMDDIAEGKEDFSTTEEKTATPEKSLHDQKFVDEPTLKESDKPGFDQSSVQPALSDSDDEGGVARPRTAATMKNFKGPDEEGGQLKQKPDLQADSKEGMFEVTGFTVSYEPKKGSGEVSVQIRDYFVDVATAMASVNGNKYLMPLDNGGYKVATITQGAPSISYGERQLYEYIQGKWVK